MVNQNSYRKQLKNDENCFRNLEIHPFQDLLSKLIHEILSQKD